MPSLHHKLMESGVYATDEMWTLFKNQRTRNKKKKLNCSCVNINHSTGAIDILSLISEVESDMHQVHRLCTT